MSRPLQRGISGTRNSSGGSQELWDSPMKDKIDRDDLSSSSSSRRDSSDHPRHNQSSSTRSPSKYISIENGFSPDSLTPRSQHRYILLLLRFSLFFIVIVTLCFSFWWTLSVSASPRGAVNQHYRVLQERVLSDLRDMGELSLGSPRSRELDFCPEEYENIVPCYSYNASDSVLIEGEVERHCRPDSRLNCLVIPPASYKVPLRWLMGKDIIWKANVKITAEQVLSSGSLTKRMMILEEEQISFSSAALTFDGIEDYAQQIAKMIGLRNEYDLVQAGVRTILDVGCGYGSFGAHLFSKQLLTMCIANYETSGSQVQLTLERGLPAMIGSFFSKQLPYPSLSFDMLHCLRCGVEWDKKDGLFLVEADRVLKPGGYFVWTSPLTVAPRSNSKKGNPKRWNAINSLMENLCWELIAQQDETRIWKKTSKMSCYASRKPGMGPSLCNKGEDAESPFYHPLQSCIAGTHSKRWIPIEARKAWPSRANLNTTEVKLYGLHSEDFLDDMVIWKAAVRDYWSLLSPLIFSDHPKRPGDEDPIAPYNMVRNVLDMNSHLGGFNSALLEAGKNLWVMNVVPINGPNYLPAILDRGFLSVLHDWCEAFPTYPRTYDMVHAAGLLSLETGRKRRCSLLDLFTEVDRILRPEGWVIIRDTTSLIESARSLTTKLKWDARVIEVESNTDERLLIAQKPFFKRLAS